MIKCPLCETEQTQNTVFCSECGTYLVDENSQGTDPLGTGELIWVGEDTAPPIEPEKTGSTPQSIHLTIKGSGRHFDFTMSNSVLIGRLDPANNVFPEVDLTVEGALEKGVSRRHARILKKSDKLILEDMGSINGTFVNSKRLIPYHPEILADGDQLQLGQILIDIKFR